MSKGRRLFCVAGSAGIPAFGTRLIQPGALAGGGIVTFSRAQVGVTSTALAAGAAAWWTEYAADAPRYAGSANRLLLGGQRTTMNTRGRLIGGTGWTLGSVSAATTTGPDGGGATANQIDEGTATAAHQTSLAGVSHTSGVSYAMSAIVKAETCTTCQLVFASAAFGVTAFQNFDIGAGALGTGGAGAVNARIVALGSGWYWISVSAVATATASSNPINLHMTDSASAVRAVSYTGTSRTMLAFWGWEEDASTFPSSAILSAAEPAAATRGQDSLTANFSTLFPTGVGTVLASFLVPYASTAAVSQFFEIHDGTSNNRILIWTPTTGGGVIVRASRTIAGVFASATDLGTFTPDTLFRVGLTFDGATITANFNGGANQTVAGQPAGLTALRVGNNAGGTSALFGQVGYFDTLPYVIPGANLPAAVSAIP